MIETILSTYQTPSTNLENLKMKIQNLFPDSFLLSLNLIYNNINHFTLTDTNFNFCTRDKLLLIQNAAIDPNLTLKIDGTPHTNFHTSNVVINETFKPLFVEDEYIRLYLPGEEKVIHFLVRPPRIAEKNYLFPIINLSLICDAPPYIVSPIG